MSSGAIQYGVPTRDLRRGTSLFTWAQNPKSESFTCQRGRGRSGRDPKGSGGRSGGIFWGSYPPIVREEDGVTLDVTVDDALGVEHGERPQH